MYSPGNGFILWLAQEKGNVYSIQKLTVAFWVTVVPPSPRSFFQLV